jgi:hypothetical protein
VTNRGWKRPFDDPIPLPRGYQLVTLGDAGIYITKMPKAEHEAAEWEADMEALNPGGDVGPTMFARIGVTRALNRGHVRELVQREKILIGGSANSRETNEARRPQCFVVLFSSVMPFRHRSSRPSNLSMAVSKFGENK